MAKKEGKILEELRRQGKIWEDPAPVPKAKGMIGWLVDLLSKNRGYRETLSAVLVIAFVYNIFFGTYS